MRDYILGVTNGESDIIKNKNSDLKIIQFYFLFSTGFTVANTDHQQQYNVAAVAKTQRYE